MAGFTHLARRFFGSLRPGGPSAADADWAEAELLPDEVTLWRSMSRADRRHAAGVARRVEVALGNEATRPVLAAALLHDVGKTESGLGTYGRVIATISGGVIGRDPAIVRAWTRTRGFTRSVGLYLQHPRIGADLLAMAGSDPLTVTWAREHHLPEDQWTIDPHIGEVLKTADDD
jgi:hypothetical protein